MKCIRSSDFGVAAALAAAVFLSAAPSASEFLIAYDLTRGSAAATVSSANVGVGNMMTNDGWGAARGNHMAFIRVADVGGSDQRMDDTISGGCHTWFTRSSARDIGGTTPFDIYVHQTDAAVANIVRMGNIAPDGTIALIPEPMRRALLAMDGSVYEPRRRGGRAVGIA